MCGRYYIDQEEDIAEMRRILEEVNRRFTGSALAARMKTGEIVPTDVVPALSAASDASGTPFPTISLMQWGMTTPQSGGVIINARSETASEKPMFRRPVGDGRALLPASAFFEWQKNPDGRTKTKSRVSIEGDRFFYMAGLFRPERLAGTGDTVNRFVIVTVPANEQMAPVHDRMPLILARDEARRFLLDPKAALAMLASPPPCVLAAEKV